MIGGPCNDNDSCTINDALDEFCYCRGIENHRYVMNPNDIGAGSLRDAITKACNGDTITFTAGVTDTIRLNSDIVINKSLVLLAEANQDIIISGQLTTRIFQVQSSQQLTLSHITLHGGNEPTEGGAILNNGTLILEHTTFKDNWQGNAPRPWTNHGQVTVKLGTNYVRLN